MNQSNLTRGYSTAVISAAILSTTAIFIRHLTEEYDLPPMILAFWRDGFVAITLLVVLGGVRPALLKVERRQLGYLAGYGFMLAIFNSLWTLSVALNGAAVATVLAYSSAGFTALLGWWLLNERLDGAKLLAVGISLSGCALVAGAFDPAAWNSNLAGIVMGLLSGLSYATYTLLGRNASQRGLSPWTSLIYIFSFATVYLMLFNLAWSPDEFFHLGHAAAGWGVLFLLAAGPTVLGFGLYNLSLTYLPSSVVNLIVTMEPAFTAVFAYFLLHERLTSTQIAGSLILLGSIVFLRIYEGRVAAFQAQRIESAGV